MLVAELYLDHDVDHGLVPCLAEATHVARTAGQIGRSRAADFEHLLLAQQNRWVLVTHNWSDYRLLHGAWLHWFPAMWPAAPFPSPAGIVVIPQAVRHRRYWLPEYAAHEIGALLATGVPLENALYRWQPSRGWVRH